MAKWEAGYVKDSSFVCCDYDINAGLPEAAKIRKYLMTDPIKITGFSYTLRKYETCLWIIFVYATEMQCAGLYRSD